MKKEFKLYAAAVAMATTASNGSGETNPFDHVAKDLHETGFDETYEYITDEEKSEYVRDYCEEIWQLARERYKV